MAMTVIRIATTPACASEAYRRQFFAREIF